MCEKNKIRALWPTLFGEFHNENHQNIKNELINFFEDYKKKNPSGRKKGSLGTENYNLYESKYDLHMQKNPVYDKLFSDFIMRGFFTMSNEANKSLLNNFSDKEIGVSITGSWFIHYEQGGFVLPHNHGECSWCCVYYVQVGKDATTGNGGTYFQKPTPNRTTLDFGSYYNRFNVHDFNPEEGKMLIWPSYVVHGSYPYKGDQDRIIISANANVSILENGKPINTK